jgi:pantothenate kinase
MDGFHLTREELGRFPQSAEAFARRGAPWTFDAHGAVTLIEQLSKPYSQKAGTIWVPSFDHATKDPIANAIPITESISLVLLEGNYLLYDVPPWNRISAIVDDTWFVDVDDESVKSRIAKRHMASGIAINWNDAMSRVERNDMLNGKEIISKLIKPAVRVISIDERLRSP